MTKPRTTRLTYPASPTKLKPEEHYLITSATTLPLALFHYTNLTLSMFLIRFLLKNNRFLKGCLRITEGRASKRWVSRRKLEFLIPILNLGGKHLIIKKFRLPLPVRLILNHSGVTEDSKVHYLRSHVRRTSQSVFYFFLLAWCAKFV